MIIIYNIVNSWLIFGFNDSANDIRYYCNKKIYISYITELECIREKLISDYGNIKQIKKDLIDTIDETIKSTYILDYTIYYTNRKEK